MDTGHSVTTLVLRGKYFVYQCILSKGLQSKGGKDGVNLHVLRYSEAILAYSGFNVYFKMFCGLSNIHCASALTIKEINALKNQNRKVSLNSAHQRNSHLYPPPVPPIRKLAQAS